MFRTSIKNTKFTSEDATAFFGNITGDSFSGDVSVIATLRALLPGRMSEGDELRIRNVKYTISAGDYSGKPVREFADKFSECCLLGEKNTLVLVNLNAEKDAASFVHDSLAACAGDEIPNYRYMETVRALFKKSFDVSCLVNETTRTVIVVIDNLNLRKLHYVQCAILGMFPWYFDPSKGITEEEKELIFSLREKEPDKYVAALEKMAKKYDFDTARIRRLLTGFEGRYELRIKRSVENEVSSYRDQINELNDRLSTLLRNFNEKNAYLLGLEMKQTTEESEIMDYFLCNKNVFLESVDDTVLYFIATGYISYFDEDLAARVIGNSNSCVYEHCSNAKERADMKKLMTACFIDQTVKIRVCAGYSIDIGGGLRARRGVNFQEIGNDRMANPHIDRYECMGNYVSVIGECMQRHDYIGAIEQAVASSKSLNWGDTTVMRQFFHVLYNPTEFPHYSTRCFELPTGEIVDKDGAIRWLSENE